MNFFDKKVLEKLWWYGLNIITTLFIISFINFNAPQGEPGVPGSNGTNGVDGQDGQNGADGTNLLQPVTIMDYEEAPAGTAREAYVQQRIEEGYIPLSSPEDFAIFTEVEGEPDLFGNPEAFFQNYVLTNDIDFSGIDFDQDPYFITPYYDNGDYVDWIFFEGIFDGAGYSVKNYERHEGEGDFSVGFFPYTAGATIRNLTLENLSLSSVLYEGYLGGVIGYNDGPTILENISVINFELVSDTATGGLVGGSNDELFILNASVQLGQIAGEAAGGFLGYANNDYNTFIQDSVNKATISVDFALEEYSNYISSIDAAGGFIGFTEESMLISIVNSSNEGTVQTDQGNSGGFIGQTETKRFIIANSFNTGYVTSVQIEDGSGKAGGLIGQMTMFAGGTIQNSFNAGEVHVDLAGSIGGLVGHINWPDNGSLGSLNIVNSYNAGYLSSTLYGADAGGLVGYADYFTHTNVVNSFNVGTFSESIVQNPENIYNTTGAIIGALWGTASLDNVTYFYGEENTDNYLSRAVGRRLDDHNAQLTDIGVFQEDAFVFENQWNFEDIWTFENDGYSFPVLQHNTDVRISEFNSYDPILVYLDWNVFDSKNGDYDTRTYEFFWYWGGDAETYYDELSFSLYGSLIEADTPEELKDYGELVDTFTFIDSDFFMLDPIEYTPTLGSGLYYMYLIVEDSDQNELLTFLHDWAFEEPLPDTTAPVPGGLGNVIAEFNDFPGQVSLDFALATDDVTAQEDLIYYVVVAVENFDFETWDLVWTNSSLKFVDVLVATGEGPYLFDIEAHDQFPTVTDLEINTYYDVAVYVQDLAGNLSMYEVASLSYID
jgi:hypothetical protein